MQKLVDGGNDQMTNGRHRPGYHAPLQRQRKHRVRHKDDEQNVPNQVLAFGKAQPLADEALQVQQQPRANGRPVEIVVGKQPPTAQHTDQKV